MSTQIITRGALAEVPTVSVGLDINKGASLNGQEFDQNLVNLRAAIDAIAAGDLAKMMAISVAMG